MNLLMHTSIFWQVTFFRHLLHKQLLINFAYNSDSSYRQYGNFIAVQLRLCLSDYSPVTYVNIWKQLSVQTQSDVKHRLFDILCQDMNLTTKNHIADTIGQIAGTLINNQEGWPNFATYLWGFFKGSKIESIIVGFSILERFLSLASTYFNDCQNMINQLLCNGLLHEDSKVKLSTLKCLKSYLGVMKPNKRKEYKSMVENIFQSVYYLITHDYQSSGLRVLGQMLETAPIFFKQQIVKLTELCRSIYKLQNFPKGIRRMTVQMLVDFAQKLPTLFRRQPPLMQGLTEMIFSHMVEISEEILENWKRPYEGYSEQLQGQQDFETTRFGMNAIDRLIYVIGEEEMLPIIYSFIEQLLMNQNWKYHYSATMTLSQIGEYIPEPQNISGVITIVVNFLQNQNPMIRYAACHAIGQFSDDMNPKFQQQYGAQVFPKLVSILQYDSVPKVIAHSAYALTNFLQGMKYGQILNQLDILIRLLLEKATTGISLEKEGSLSALSSLLQICQEKYEPYLSVTQQILFHYFQDQKFSGREYHLLKGQAIETLTILVSSIRTDLFRPYSNKLIELMISLQQLQLQKNDSQRINILKGWQRICEAYGRQLETYLDRIIPSLLSLVEKVIYSEIDMESSNDQKSDQANINSEETQEARSAIELLNVFLSTLQNLYFPYIERTVVLLSTIIKGNCNADIKKEACQCLPLLIVLVYEQNLELAIHLAKLFLSVLTSSIYQRSNTSLQISQLTAMKNILSNMKIIFLSHEQLFELSKNILDLLKSCNDKKQSMKNDIQDLEEQEIQEINEKIKEEQKVQIGISDVVEMLFKYHKQGSLNLAQHIVSNMLPCIFEQKQSDNMIRFGIYLIDDMIQFLGFGFLSNQWNYFVDVLLQYTNHTNCSIRQAACYGLGIFAENTPSHILKQQIIYGWLYSLINSVKIPNNKSDQQKVYRICRDNAVASIGKIIKTHLSIFEYHPYLAVWVQFLPIRFDLGQSVAQSQLFVDLLQKQPNLIIGKNKITTFKKILIIYADIVGNKRYYNQQLATKIKQHIEILKQNPFFVANFSTIYSALTNKQSQNLSHFMK